MNTRKKMLRIRFSDDEWQALNAIASDADMTMSEVVRDHLGKVKIRNRKDERERTAMLNRINANLNMIARWVNTHKGDADAVQVISHLIAVERQIKGLIK